MQAVFNFILQGGAHTAPVLILGESGTGKEMVAQALHRRGPQKNGPFIAINCNAIPENLLESELFGHEKGSFTGAHTQRKGTYRIGRGRHAVPRRDRELPAAVQVKLLRFLQEKRFQRVGGRQEIHSDARVIAATNVNLKESVASGKFSRGPVLPAGRGCREGASLAREGRRHWPDCEGVPAPLWCRARQTQADFRPRCHARPQSSSLAGKRP
jgi:transcriptional regulator with PAS, ATPase and Fis domain